MAGSTQLPSLSVPNGQEAAGVVGECCNWFCDFTCKKPYVMMFFLVASLVSAEICAFAARNLKVDGDNWWKILLGFGGVTAAYLGVLALIFWKKKLLKKKLTTWREGPLKDYWCYFQGVRAIAVIGTLRTFLYISDILSEKKDLGVAALWFYYSSYLHIVLITKLLTIKDLIGLADSLLAVGIMVAAKVDSNKNPIISLLSYFTAVGIVIFRFSKVPYGHEENQNDGENGDSRV